MTATNFLVPPPELAEEWRMDYMGRGHAFIDVAIKAVQWGADQELEACCEWFADDVVSEVVSVVAELRAARRPKPPSLKEQALAELDRIPTYDNEGQTWGVDVFTIRRALEALDD